MRALALLLLFASAAVAQTPELSVQSGHRGSVAALVLTPDGATLISGGNDGTVKLWDRKTGALRRTLPRPYGRVTGLALRGKLLAIGGINSFVALWDLEAGRYVLHQRFQERGGYGDVGLSPDGATLVACGDEWICLFETATGKELRRIKGPKRDRFYAVRFVDDKRFVAASDERVIYVYGTDGERQLTISGLDGRVYDLRVVKERVFSMTSKGTVYAHAVGTGGLLHRWDAIGKATELSLAGEKLAVSCEDGTLAILTPDGAVVERVTVEGKGPPVAAFAGEAMAAARSSRPALYSRVAGKWTRSREFRGAMATPRVVATADDGRLLVGVARKKRLHVFDTRSGKDTWSGDGPGRMVLSPDGTHVGIGAKGKPVRCHALATGERAFAGVTTPVAGTFAIAPGGKRLALRRSADLVHVYTADGKHEISLPGNNLTNTLGLAFDRAGEMLMQGGKGDDIRLLDLKGKLLARSKMQSGWVVSFATSRDGTRLLVGGPYSALTLRDRTLKRLRTMKGHRGSVWSCAFNKAETRLISIGGEGTLRIWNAADGALLGIMRFFDTGDWILVAGARYDASPGARPLCRWIVGREQHALDACPGVERVPGLLDELQR